MGKMHTVNGWLMHMLTDPELLINSNCLCSGISHWETVLGQVLLVFFWPRGTSGTSVDGNVHPGRLLWWCRWDAFLSFPFAARKHWLFALLCWAGREVRHKTWVYEEILTLKKSSDTHWNNKISIMHGNLAYLFLQVHNKRQRAENKTQYRWYVMWNMRQKLLAFAYFKTFIAWFFSLKCHFFLMRLQHDCQLFSFRFSLKVSWKKRSVFWGFFKNRNWCFVIVCLWHSFWVGLHIHTDKEETSQTIAKRGLCH